jgi:lantibiotic leader peptide-processing serine protease
MVVSIANLAGGRSVEAASNPPPTSAAEYARQWNLRAIHAEAAWSAGLLGSRGVAVAVLDTGIDTNHPDLAGIVDSERSRSLLSMSPSCPPTDPGAPSPTMEDDVALGAGLPLYTDYHGHGTAVSGLVSSNAVVLAGVTQRTKLIAVKVHGRNRTNCISVYLEAIRYAADAGADVIHMSFPLEFSNSAFPGVAARVDEATTYAHDKGALLVAAAGNASQDLDATPDRFRFCMAAYVICVSATGPADPADVSPPAWDAPADYTNFGNAIDVAGPGGTGTFPTQVVPVWLDCSRVTLVTSPAQAPSQCRNEPHLIWASTGTSFGAGATSGLLALLVDLVGKNRPDQVEEVLRASADDLGEPGKDRFYGDGRINVENAIDLATP